MGRGLLRSRSPCHSQRYRRTYSDIRKMSPCPFPLWESISKRRVPPSKKRSKMTFPFSFNVYNLQRIPAHPFYFCSEATDGANVWNSLKGVFPSASLTELPCSLLTSCTQRSPAVFIPTLAFYPPLHQKVARDLTDPALVYLRNLHGLF